MIHAGMWSVVLAADGHRHAPSDRPQSVSGIIISACHGLTGLLFLCTRDRGENVGVEPRADQAD